MDTEGSTEEDKKEAEWQASIVVNPALIMPMVAVDDGVAIKTTTSDVYNPATDMSLDKSGTHGVGSSNFSDVARGRRMLIMLSILVAISGYTYFSAIKFIKVSIAALLLYTYPLFVVLFAACGFGGHQPSRIQIISHLIAFGGLVFALSGPIIFGQNDDIAFDSTSIVGYICALISSIAFAVYCVAATKLSSTGLSPLMGATYVNFYITIILGIVFAVGTVVAPTDPMFVWSLPATDDVLSMCCLFGACLIYTFSQVAMFGAFHLADQPAKVTFLFNLDPVVSIALSASVLGETFLWYQWLGLGVLVSSLSYCSIATTKKKENLEITSDTAFGIQEIDMI